MESQQMTLMQIDDIIFDPGDPTAQPVVIGFIEQYDDGTFQAWGTPYSYHGHFSQYLDALDAVTHHSMLITRWMHQQVRAQRLITEIPIRRVRRISGGGK